MVHSAKTKTRAAMLVLMSFWMTGCVVGTAVGVAGDVVEGAANVTVGTVKTAGKVAGAVVPDGEDKSDDEQE